MKMRKYFVMALVALGATAAFSSCQKDPKAYDAPKVEFRDANNAVIKEFNQASFGAKKEITVVVTLGDSKEVTLKKLEVSVVTDNSTIKKPYTVSTIKGNAGDVKDKLVGTVKLEDLQIAEGDYAKSGLKIVAEATDSRNKLTKEYCVYKAKGGETQTGTPMGKEVAAYINHAKGSGDGAFSFSKKQGVSLTTGAAADMEFVNESTGTDFEAKFSSKTRFKFVKVNGKIDYANATVEAVSAAVNEGPLSDKVEDLVVNDLFVACDENKENFYLVQVKKIQTGKFYYDKEEKASSAKNGWGYMLFNYKPSK